MNPIFLSAQQHPATRYLPTPLQSPYRKVFTIILLPFQRGALPATTEQFGARVVRPQDLLRTLTHDRNYWQRNADVRNRRSKTRSVLHKTQAVIVCFLIKQRASPHMFRHHPMAQLQQILIYRHIKIK